MLKPIFLLTIALLQTPRPVLTVAVIEAQGAKRYTTQQVTALSGIRPGQTITPDGIAAAAKRLIATGLFKSLAYRYVPKTNRVTVIFSFEEADWTIPVVFDNFIWFSDEALTAAVAKDVPSFDRTAPGLPGATKLIAESLQRFLESRRIDGRVELGLQGDPQTGMVEYRFSVRDPSPKVCAIRVAGASAIPERELLAAVPPLIGSDYSRSYVASVTDRTFSELYRRRGYWAAAVMPPAVSVDTAGCAGAEVAVAVSEGVPYVWNGAEWTGNTAVQVTDLDRALAMPAGAPAASGAVDEGLRRVAALYRKNGYLLEQHTFTPRLEAGSERVTFEIRIVEGSQFRLGTLQFAGVTEEVAAAMRNRWQLKSGEVFDDSYPTRFVLDELRRAVLERGGRARAPEPHVRIDADSRLAHVTVTFK